MPERKAPHLITVELNECRQKQLTVCLESRRPFLPCTDNLLRGVPAIRFYRGTNERRERRPAGRNQRLRPLISRLGESNTYGQAVFLVCSSNSADSTCSRLPKSSHSR